MYTAASGMVTNVDWGAFRNLVSIIGSLKFHTTTNETETIFAGCAAWVGDALFSGNVNLEIRTS